MRFSEIILRIGTGLVAWMVVLAYFLWLATAWRVGCDADGEGLYGLVMAFGPVALAFAALIRVTRPLPDIHGMLRWLAVIPALLAPLALSAFPPVYRAVYQLGESICSPAAPPAWQQFWLPVQGVCLLGCTYLLVRNWRFPAAEN